MKFGRRIRDRTNFRDLTIWAGGVGGRLIWKKSKKLSIFNLQTGDGILMKFYVWKDIVSKSCYFKSRPDLVTLGELEGDLKSWKTLRMEGSG